MVPAQTALVYCDLQNGFMHAHGAYGKNGVVPASFAAIPGRVKAVAEAMRAAGGWIISTHFVLIAGKDGQPMIAPSLKRLRPFLGAGDFSPGSFDCALHRELPAADFSVEKVAFSAFYMSRLDWLLSKARIDTLFFAGVMTNGGVASTLRDAHVREFHCTLLADGCGAATPALHDAAVKDLSSIAQVMRCQQAAEHIRQHAA